MIRVVLDTNLLVSALLFENGRLSWRNPPLLGHLLPWCETNAGPIEPTQHLVRDPKDQVFLDLALAAGVPMLVSGDGDVLALKNELTPLLILTPAEFQSWLAAHALRRRVWPRDPPGCAEP